MEILSFPQRTVLFPFPHPVFCSTGLRNSDDAAGGLPSACRTVDTQRMHVRLNHNKLLWFNFKSYLACRSSSSRTALISKKYSSKTTILSRKYYRSQKSYFKVVNTVPFEQFQIELSRFNSNKFFENRVEPAQPWLDIQIRSLSRLYLWKIELSSTPLLSSEKSPKLPFVPAPNTPKTRFSLENRVEPGQRGKRGKRGRKRRNTKGTRLKVGGARLLRG